MVRLNFKQISFSCIGFVAGLLTSTPSHAQNNEVQEDIAVPHAAVNLSVASLTSVTAERGAYVAASFQGDYLFHEDPFYLLTRLTFGDSITGNDTWRFDHYHQQLELGLGIRKQLGRGTFFGQLSGGILGVYEVASHHQLVRVGEEMGRFTNWSLGPMLASEMGLELNLAAGFSSRMAVGPTWTLQKIDDSEVHVFGALANLGLRYAF